MNIDLITKLAKLANNNPNEHEANSAARRVCQLLAEGKFQFGAVVQTTAEARIPNPYYANPASASSSYWNDVLKQANAAQQQSADQNKYQPYYQQQNYNPYTRQRPKIKLKCTRCGIDYVIDFNGPPEYFVCISCAMKGL